MANHSTIIIVKLGERMFLESRRKFLKGTAYGVAGATVATGVFTTVIAEETKETSKFTSTPDRLDFYPPVE